MLANNSNKAQPVFETPGQEDRLSRFRIRPNEQIDSIDAAGAYALQRFKHSNSPIFLVAAHGLPNTGKTFFLNALKEKAELEGIAVLGRFNSALSEGELLSLRSTIDGGRYMYVMHYGDYAFHNNGMTLPTSELQIRHGFGEPNAYSLLETGREIDLMIAIYGAERKLPRPGNYDLTIRNTLAVKKQS